MAPCLVLVSAFPCRSIFSGERRKVMQRIASRNWPVLSLILVLTGPLSGRPNAISRPEPVRGTTGADLGELYVLDPSVLGLVLPSASSFSKWKEPALCNPSAAIVSGSCRGRVHLELEGKPARPTGPAWLECINPCAGGCAKYSIVLAGSGQKADKCGCGSASGPPSGCDVVLSPPNAKGGPLPYGSCPDGKKCIVEGRISTGIFEAHCR